LANRFFVFLKTFGSSDILYFSPDEISYDAVTHNELLISGIKNVLHTNTLILGWIRLQAALSTPQKSWADVYHIHVKTQNNGSGC